MDSLRGGCKGVNLVLLQLLADILYLTHSITYVYILGGGNVAFSSSYQAKKNFMDPISQC